MSHATMFAHECETSPIQNSSELFCFEEDQAQLTQFNINTSSPLKIEIPSDYSPLVFSANISKNLSSPSSSDIKASPSKPRQRSRFIRNNSQSSDRSSESTGRTRKFFPRISKELSTSKESLVSSKSSYSNVKPECSNSDIDDGLISDISLNDSISLNRTMICSPYVQVQVMSDELLHHWSKTTENKSSCASLKGKVSNVNSSPSLVNTTKPTTKQPLSIKNKIDIVESSLPTTKKCLVTSKKYVTTSSPKQSSTIENKNLYSPSFDILNESLVPDQHKVGKGNSLSNICMPSSPTLNNAKLSLSQLTKSEAKVDSKKVFTHNHDVIEDKEIGDSLQRRSRRHLSESSSDSRISMSRDIDEVESVSKMSSEAQVDSKKVVTHSHDVIKDKEIGDSPQRRLKRHLSESSSDRISMSRDIDEFESVSKMSSEAQVDSKKVVTHNHDVIEDKEIGDSLQRRLKRNLSESSSDSRISMSRDIDEFESVSKMSSKAQVDSKKIVTHSHDVTEDKEISNSLRRRLRRNLSESSSDSRISMSRDIDEVESLSKISSQVSPTKQKITHKLNFPYQQINFNVAEVKHLDLNQIALCDTPESISNNSSTTSKINTPSILEDDEEKNFCHETETNSYKSLHLVSTYDSDQVNTTIPAQKQTVMLKALQTPASKNAVGETPSIVCEDISLKLSKSAEALGSDQATSKQNLVQVEGHKVAISDDKTPVTIKSSPQCTSSLDCNSRATAPTSNKRFRLKRNFSSNLSKSNTVQTSSDMYPIEQEKLCFQKTTEKLIPSVQLVSSQNTLEKILSKEIPDYSSLSTEDASLQISKNKVTVNSFVNKVTTKTSSEEAKHTKKLIAEITSKEISKNNLPSTKPSLTEEFCEDLSSQNNSSRINVKRNKYGTPLSTYKITSKDTSTGSLVDLVSHSENFPTQLKLNTEVTKTPKPILKDESTKWAQAIVPENIVCKEKDFNSLKNIGRLTKKLSTPNIPSKKLVSNSINSKPHLPETCLQKSTSITQITASETLKSSSTFHKKIISSNILTSNSIDSNEPSSSLVGRNKKKPLKNSANNSSKQVDVFSPQLERSSKTSSNPTKPVEPFSSPFERPPKASPSNPTRLNEPYSSGVERLQKTLSHSSTKPVGHFSPPSEMPPKISPSNPPKIVEPFPPKVERPPKSTLSNLTKPFEQFSPPLKRLPTTLSNFSKPTKLVSSKFAQHQSLPRMSSNTTTKLSTRPTTSNFKPSKPALNNCIRSSKPSWPDNNTIFKHPSNPSDFKKVSHTSLGQSPSTPTSMSDPAVSGHLRDEDNESDEDLDAISLFAETDIGFEQRPAEVRPKNIHPDNPFAKSDSDSDISNNSDNESRPLELPVPEFMHYLNKEKESHQTVTNIPLNDKVDSNVDFPRWRNDNYQECDQSSGNENDGSECSIEVPFREEVDSHNTSSLTAEDRFDTYDDAHSMAEEREFETENENKYFAEEEDNLEDLRYNGTANNDSPNLPDKAAEQHCETNIAHYMSGYFMQHGITEDVTPMGYHSPSQHSSSSCRKPQEGKFCFTFLKHGNCKKYPHNCNYNHCVPHHSLSAPIEAGNYLLFTYSKGFNHASNFILTSLIKEIIDKNETNINRNDQELWDILVKMLIKCGKPVVSLLNTLINTFVSIISDLPLKSFDSAISLLLIVAKYNSLHLTWSSVKALIWATDLKGTVDVVTKYINVCNTLSTPDKEFIVDVYKYFIELNPAIKNCEDISVRKFASVLQKNGLTHFANNLKIIAPKAFGLKPSEHKPGPSFTATIKKCDESQQNSSGSMSGLMEMGPHLPQERRSNVLLPPAKVPIPPKRLNNTPRFSAESINNTFVKPDSQVPNTFSDTDLRNRLQISHNSSASSQECSPQEKLTSVCAELSTQHNNRNMNMKRVTRRGEQPSPLDSISDQIDHSLHSQNITRVPKLTNSNPHNVHLSNANISSNSTFQERSSDDLDYADTMSSYVHNNEERFDEPLSYTDNINKPFYSISSTKHPIGNTTFGPKLFFPPGIPAGLNKRDSGGKYWEDEGYSTHASSLPLPDSSRETFQDMAQLSNFSTQRPFEFQGKYGPNFQCPQRPQLPPQLLSNKPPQGPKLHNRVRRRRQSQTQWHPIHEPPNSNCGPVNEDECRRVFEQEWNLTLKNLKGGNYRSVNARLNNWKNRAERNEFCARVYQELIRNGESAAPNFRRLVESAVSDSVISLRNNYDLKVMMSSIGMLLLLDLCSKSIWETAYQIHFVMKKYCIDPLMSQTEHDATTSQAQKIFCCIEVCMNSNHGKDAVDILAAYKLQNPYPNQWQLASNPADVDTRNLLVATLLEGLVESNYVKEARKLFDLLYTAQKSVKKPIDIAKHLNTLLVFLLDANLNVEALNLFLKIDQPALPVEVVTYRALLAACVEKHMMKAAETLWRSLGLFGVFSFQVITYPLVIKMKSYFMKEEIYMELKQYFLQLSKSLSPDQLDANDTECRVNIHIEEFPIGHSQKGVRVPSVVRKAELASSYIKVRLKNVLKHDFQIELDKECGDNIRLIALKSESVKNYLRKLHFLT